MYIYIYISDLYFNVEIKHAYERRERLQTFVLFISTCLFQSWSVNNHNEVSTNNDSSNV